MAKKPSWQLRLPKSVFSGRIDYGAGTQELTRGYLPFKEEACNLNPDYRPRPLTPTDGSPPGGWKTLFPGITLLLCFLHSVLKITDRCKRSRQLLAAIKEKVWNVYQPLLQLNFPSGYVDYVNGTNHPPRTGQGKGADLVAKPRSSKRLLAPSAYRTSNALDRLMDYQDRLLYASGISIGIAIVPYFICDPWL